MSYDNVYSHISDFQRFGGIYCGHIHSKNKLNVTNGTGENRRGGPEKRSIQERTC